MNEYSNDPVNDANRYYAEVGMKQEMEEQAVKDEETRIRSERDWYESVLNSVADPVYELATILRYLDDDIDDAIQRKNELLRLFASENIKFANKRR